jgi:hypothetical protein
MTTTYLNIDLFVVYLTALWSVNEMATEIKSDIKSLFKQ